MGGGADNLLDVAGPKERVLKAMRGRVMAAAAGMAVLGLAVGGCSGGSKPDPAGKAFASQLAASLQTRAKVMAAVQDLRKDPVVGYDGPVPGSATTGDAKITVSRAGAASGSVDLDGENVDVYEAGGQTLIKSGKSYWDSKAGGATKAAQYAGKWVKSTADNGIGFDPAQTLKPDALGRRLQGTLSMVGTPVQDKVDDTDALRIPVVGGNLYITTKAPYRLLEIDVPGLLSQGGQGKATGKGLKLDHLDPDAVDKFYDDLKGEDLSGALDTSVTFTQSGTGKLDCKTGGLCTASVSFSTSTADTGVDKVTALLNVTMTASGLPTKKCSATKPVSANGSSSMSCKADFALAPSPHPKTYRVLAKYALTAKASIDQKSINKKLDAAKKTDHDAAKKNE